MNDIYVLSHSDDFLLISTGACVWGIPIVELCRLVSFIIMEREGLDDDCNDNHVKHQYGSVSIFAEASSKAGRLLRMCIYLSNSYDLAVWIEQHRFHDAETLIYI